MWETQVWSLSWEDPLEKEMATHSSILAWRIPWTEEPGRPQSTGSQRVGHDWTTSLHFIYIYICIYTHIHILLLLFLWRTLTDTAIIQDKNSNPGFPGGSVVNNPPANAGTRGSLPGPGRSHTPCSNEACAPRLLSLSSRARQLQLPKPSCPGARVLQQEKTQPWEAHMLQLESGPCSPQIEKSPDSKDPEQQQRNR